MSPLSRRLCLCAGLVLLAFSALPADAQVPGGPFQYHSLTPCRVLDTRDGSGASPSDTPPGARPNPGPYDIEVKGFCSVPETARAVTINITVVQPTANGDLRIANQDAAPFPLVATLAYPPNETALANGAIVPLKAGAGVDLRMMFGMGSGVPGTASLHIIMDVTGYFE